MLKDILEAIKNYHQATYCEVLWSIMNTCISMYIIVRLLNSST